jgi:phage portal protein BeeE
VLSSNVEMELDLSGFLRGDPQTRWANHKIAIDAGVLDTDEVRQVEGWNPRSQAAA